MKSPDYGRIVSMRQFDRLHQILVEERDVITYGGRSDRDDLYIEPTIIEQVKWSSPSMQDELFGPILPVMVYDDLRLAIHQIRQLPKPLAAYFFSRNMKKPFNIFFRRATVWRRLYKRYNYTCRKSTFAVWRRWSFRSKSYHGKASFETLHIQNPS